MMYDSSSMIAMAQLTNGMIQSLLLRQERSGSRPTRNQQDANCGFRIPRIDVNVSVRPRVPAVRIVA